MVSEGLDRDELIGLLKESKVLTPSEVDRFGEAHPGATGKDISEALVGAGLVTQFQMEAIAAGKASDLRIGNYDVLDRLGAGGMGTVYKARHRRMKRTVALKVLAKNLSKDATFVARFQREVETIAKLNHPNIVMAYDADEAEIGHFLVMEFVDGRDLASAVQKQGPMSVSVAVGCILHAARGLAYAHGQNIIHRDIKPANLLRDASGVVKVTDLGLARLNLNANTDQTAATSVTQAGSVLGTADYMPPEQAVDSTAIDHRADIYSLGATLYFLLTGKAPYSAGSLMAILLKHRDAPIPSLSETRKDTPPALDDLFRSMLAKDPRHRPKDMAQVVAAIENLLINLGAEPAVPTPTSPPVPDRPTDTDQILEKTVVGNSPVIGMQPARSTSASDSMASILLVEPSRTQAGIIRKYLQSLGLGDIITATTGAEALKAVSTHRPCVVVTAMHLNDMTGTQLARQIRSDSSTETPGFVLISSESESKEAEVLGHSGHAALLHKPFTAESLMNALKLASPVFANWPSPTGPSGITPRPPQLTRSQCRVLLVDDSAAARLHVRNVLARLGLTQVREAEDGAQAVALLAREKFDLIVTDFNMPLMDGHGLAGYIRQNPATANTPIIMVTTETDPSKLDNVKRLGVVVCEKSFPADVAQKIIDTLLKG